MTYMTTLHPTLHRAMSVNPGLAAGEVEMRERVLVLRSFIAFPGIILHSMSSLINESKMN